MQQKNVFNSLSLTLSLPIIMATVVFIKINPGAQVQ